MMQNFEMEDLSKSDRKKQYRMSLSEHITNLTSNLVRPWTELQGHGTPGSHTPRDGTLFPVSIPVSSTPPESAQPLLRSPHNRHAVQIYFDILEQHACHICLKSTRF